MSNKLCVDCQLTFEQKYGIKVIAAGDFPWMHCHHEVVLHNIKEECWCKNQKRFEEWWKCLYPTHRYKIHFCPSCGESLGGRFIKL